mgnify:CR=1 FL=1
MTIYLLGDIMDKLRRIAMKLKESFLTGLIGPTNDTQLTIVVEKVNTDVVDVIFKTNVLVYWCFAASCASSMGASFDKVLFNIFSK